MARPLRVEYSGAFYHVMNRGNAGETLFKSKRDRIKFLEYLESTVDRFSIRIHTFCLMGNHYHLLVETPEPNLSKAIQWLNVSYAVYFNRKHQRNGHLFQGRFKSILVDADEYLTHLSRYIHLNPVRAKMVENPADYSWSSYGSFVRNVKPISWLETDLLLSQFGRKREAKKRYKAFVESIDIKNIENPNKELTAGFILGSNDFVSWVRETFLQSLSGEKEIPQLRKLKHRADIDTIVNIVADEFNCNKGVILSRGRKRNIARDMAIYLSRNITDDTVVNLGSYFGNISGAGITVRCTQFQKMIEKEKKLKTQTEKIKLKIINN
jgi:REP-associated tyrosine transposase